MVAVEIEVFCRQRPDRLLVCRLAGWVMRTVMDVEQGDAVVAEDDEHVWLARWGTSVSAQVVELPPGDYEFADRWSLTFAPGERGVDPSKLFAVVLADAAAVLCDGFLRDEIGLVGGGQRAAGDLSRVLLRRAPTSESTASSVLKDMTERSSAD
ncbi:hypothetical protein EV644_105404 [Kribbella orskensis]|uniref:Uncharacterized protein n=1 Tax=Kribbella orskensis TaxID=2512216 RepID=A0ABY2BME8_9ACTN|nr:MULTISPECIES: hypothetical protein [Kribbella]TCN41118.1 hypothetical protein EV642_104404 [Kribbella sp. VKM Ac-2500]TCO24370.1 hypothetical protein EV644_105404 [Kribbella orskensis]